MDAKRQECSSSSMNIARVNSSEMNGGRGVSVSFRTSWYGRFGHVAMAIVPAFTAFVSGGLLFVGAVPVDGSWPGVLFVFALSCSVFGTLYCVSFALERRDRVTCTLEHMSYRGFFGTTTVPWSAVTDLWLNFAGRSPFVFLMIKTRKPKRWVYTINASGLMPSYVELFYLARERCPDATITTPLGYARIDGESNAMIRVFAEDAVDPHRSSVERR